MKLSQWVAECGGISVVASRLVVTRQTVFYWLKRGTLPRLETMIVIQRISGGRVTPAEIAREAHSIRQKNRRVA